MEKSIYNLIILDESGSMINAKQSTISGCNEIINTIIASQKKHPDQVNKVSIYAFQSGGNPSRYIVKNAPVSKELMITNDDYDPCGCTPLYDAVGQTVTDLQTSLKNKPEAIGSVTIITDGYENSSTDYTLPQIKSMICALKELGWNFNFIGANIDSKEYAASMAIDNHLQFDNTSEGTKTMFGKFCESRMAYAEDIDACYCDASPDEARKNLKKRSGKFFR